MAEPTTKIRTRSTLSELEFLVLSLISDGFPSGYSIIQEMKRTRAARWSTESGAVYRVIRRLEKAGFIMFVEQTRSSQRHSRVKVTELGWEEIKSWLTEVPRPQDYSFLADPLRTRAHFLAKLSVDERRKVVAQWIADNDAFIESIDQAIEESRWTEPNYMESDPFKYLALKEIVLLAKARAAWLQMLEEL